MADIPLLADITKEIGGDGGPQGNCFCALGPSALAPVMSALKYFDDEIRAHIELGRCPLGYDHLMPRLSNAEGSTVTGSTPALLR